MVGPDDPEALPQPLRFYAGHLQPLPGGLPPPQPPPNHPHAPQPRRPPHSPLSPHSRLGRHAGGAPAAAMRGGRPANRPPAGCGDAGRRRPLGLARRRYAAAAPFPVPVPGPGAPCGSRGLREASAAAPLRRWEGGRGAGRPAPPCCLGPLAGQAGGEAARERVPAARGEIWGRDQNLEGFFGGVWLAARRGAG